MKSKKVKVNLDGHGADEQLCGYENYFSLYLLECLKTFNLILFFNFFINVITSNIKNKFIFLCKILINLVPGILLDYLKILLFKKLKINGLN